jgi:hypothetical protein
MKMKITLIFTLSLLLLLNFSCKSSDSKGQSINFGFKEVISLSNSEEELKVSDYVGLYEYIWDYDHFNLPLNKLLKGDDYFIFIAAAVENSDMEVIELIRNTQSFEIQNEIDSSKFIKEILYQKNEELHIYSVVLIEKVQQIPFIISMVSENAELIKKSFINKLLDEKIN